jgi:hypothetical protein
VKFFSIFGWILAACVLTLLSAGAAGNGRLGETVPWPAGEKLVYDVRWGALLAARLEYAAVPSRQRPGCWELNGTFQTAGVVDAFYPVKVEARSLQETGPWRSLEYREQRTENGEKSDLRTTIDYAQKEGELRNRLRETQKNFSVKQESVSDLVSALYGMRGVQWKEGMRREFWVCDENKIKKCEAVFVRKETLVLPATGKKTPCVVIRARPVYGDPKKDAQGLGGNIWFSDDRARRPVRADLRLKFGTVRLDLVKTK